MRGTGKLPYMEHAAHTRPQQIDSEYATAHAAICSRYDSPSAAMTLQQWLLPKCQKRHRTVLINRWLALTTNCSRKNTTTEAKRLCAFDRTTCQHCAFCCPHSAAACAVELQCDGKPRTSQTRDCLAVTIDSNDHRHNSSMTQPQNRKTTASSICVKLA